MPRKHVVTFLSHQRGVGKTTLAVSLAAVLSADRTVRLVDADLASGGSISSYGWGGPGARVIAVDAGDAERLGALVDEATEGVTFVDAPLFDDGPMNQALLARSELVVVPVAVAHIDLPGTRSVLEVWQKARRRALVVLSLVDPRATANLRHAREALTGIGAPLARNPFCLRTTYAAAAAAHVPVTATAPSSIAVSEVRALANEVAALLR